MSKEAIGVMPLAEARDHDRALVGPRTPYRTLMGPIGAAAFLYSYTTRIGTASPRSNWFPSGLCCQHIHSLPTTPLQDRKNIRRRFFFRCGIRPQFVNTKRHHVHSHKLQLSMKATVLFVVTNYGRGLMFSALQILTTRFVVCG